MNQTVANGDARASKEGVGADGTALDPQRLLAPAARREVALGLRRRARPQPRPAWSASAALAPLRKLVWRTHLTQEDRSPDHPCTPTSAGPPPCRGGFRRQSCSRSARRSSTPFLALSIESAAVLCPLPSLGSAARSSRCERGFPVASAKADRPQRAEASADRRGHGRHVGRSRADPPSRLRALQFGAMPLPRRGFAFLRSFGADWARLRWRRWRHPAETPRRA
jgi:hypothetical protein